MPIRRNRQVTGNRDFFGIFAGPSTPLALLQKLGVYWLEEPLPRYDFSQLAELNRQVSIPIAGGENNRGLHEFRQMCEQGVYYVLQPEPLVMEGHKRTSEGWNVGGSAYSQGCSASWRRRHRDHRHVASGRHWPHAPYWELLHDPLSARIRTDLESSRSAACRQMTGLIDVPQGPGLGVAIREDLFVR